MELEYALSGVVHRYRNEKPAFMVGRGSASDLVILDGTVSSNHARIVDGPDLASVEDLGSTNGTRLNEELIAGRSSFSAGDRLMFGRVVVRVLSIGLGGAVPPAEAHAATSRYVPPPQAAQDEAAHGLVLPAGQEVVLHPGGALAVPERRLAAFIRALPRLAEARRVPDALDRLATLVQETVKADLVAVYLLNERGGGLVRAKVQEREGSTMTRPDPSNSRATLAAAGQIVQAGNAVYTGRPETPSGHRGLHVPLIAGPRRLGVISAWVPGQPAGADLRLLTVAANQASATIEALRSASAEVAGALDALLAALRQPLSALQGTLAMPQEHAIAYLEYVAAELAEFAELESGRAALAIQSFDIRPILGEVQQYQATVAGQRGVRLKFEPAPGPIVATTDPKRLAQMLHRQVGGAVKAVPPGSEVVLSAAPEGKKLALRVLDPAAPDLHAGLDLAIASRAAALQGGELAIEGSAANGTSLTVRLPLQEPR